MNSIMSLSNTSERTNIFASLNMFGGVPSTTASNNRLEETDANAEGEGKVKNRLLSMWNNVKYGMKLKTNFSKESPVWLLGKCYHRKESPDVTEMGTDVAAFTSQANLSADEDEGLEGFKADFVSRVWMTYRREFPFLNGSNFTSDCGWGCMIRSGQMLLAQALVNHFLGRGWRWNSDGLFESSEEAGKELTHRKIIKWFGDKQSRVSPFSLHSLVGLGESSGKKAGDWYGPGAVAHILKQAVKVATELNQEFESFTVCVAQDCAVYTQDIFDECDLPDKWKALILLVPMRLGAEKFNPIYAPALTALLTLEQCIGIIGGRPKHSLYFVGYQDDKLIHLDPHYCQEVVPVWSDNFSLNSFHCRSPRKLHISKLDPSCCVGFYCATKADFLSLIELVKTTINAATRSTANGMEYPMFVFCDGHSKDSRMSPRRYSIPPDMEYSTDSLDNDYVETEEFEVL